MSGLTAYVQEGVLRARAWVNQIVDARWNDAPFGRAPLASREEYLSLFETTRRQQYPAIDALEEHLGFCVDRTWLDGLALHTQITKKKSDLGYPHGRVLYALLRRMIAERDLTFVTVLETGSARGFSALCMSKAIEDAGIDGRILTIDVLPHLASQIWNCIDDHDGPKSRAEILQPWQPLARRITFLQGDTLYLMPRLGLDEVNFAFLDAQHIESSVLHEFRRVAARQSVGDMIVFDDVTPEVFPGVAKAVDRIEAAGAYEVERLTLSIQRGYAWARRSTAGGRCP